MWVWLGWKILSTWPMHILIWRCDNPITKFLTINKIEIINPLVPRIWVFSNFGKEKLEGDFCNKQYYKKKKKKEKKKKEGSRPFI